MYILFINKLKSSLNFRLVWQTSWVQAKKICLWTNLWIIGLDKKQVNLSISLINWELGLVDNVFVLDLDQELEFELDIELKLSLTKESSQIELKLLEFLMISSSDIVYRLGLNSS